MPVGETTRPAEQLLVQAFRVWPKHFVADFLITPGGFAEGQMPAGVPSKTGWQSDPRDFPAIRNAAQSVASTILTPRLLHAARGKARYLTLGIDLDAAPASRPHAELVAVVGLRSGRILRWTGKSCPVQPQENTLWRVADLGSHCLRLAGRRVLVLGCHDLNLFSQRAWNNQKPGSPGRQRTAEMRKIAKPFRPDRAGRCKKLDLYFLFLWHQALTTHCLCPGGVFQHPDGPPPPPHHRFPPHLANPLGRRPQTPPPRHLGLRHPLP